jgi:hypothetical protein
MEIINEEPSGIGPMRVADAQTGRPYSNHRSEVNSDLK